MRRENTKTNNTNGTQPEIFHLSRANQRDVPVSFDDPTISTCGELAMLKEAERNCGIISEIASVMQDRRKHWLVQHPLEEMLRQRVAQIACGYEDADDCDTLRDYMLVKLFARRGNKSTNIAGLLIRLVKRLREEWKTTEIVVRRDSHFCSHEFMDWAGTWRNAQRVIVKIEVGELGPNVRFVVTNFDGPRRDVYETGYCARGAMELMIKELKTYLHADRMSCGRFSANQFRLFLHTAAYVLLHSMQHILLADTDFENCSMLTLVTKLMLSSVRVEAKKCSIRLHFQQGHLFRKQLEWVLRMAGY